MGTLRLSLLALLLVSAVTLHAQPKKYRIEGKKCPRVTLTDPGEFYSTYDFSESDIQAMRDNKLKPALIDRIMQNHREESWPAKLGQLDERIDHPEQMKAYTLYEVTTFGNIHVLVAPAKHNSTLPEGWAPQHDIFFIVNDKALSK